MDLKKDSWVEGAGALGWVDELRVWGGGFASVLLVEGLAAGLLGEEAVLVVLVVDVVAVSARDADPEGLIAASGGGI